MSIIDKIKQIIKSFISSNEWVSEEEIHAQFIEEWDKLENELMLFAGDSGDGISRESLIECVASSLNKNDTNYPDYTINLAINNLLHEGKLLTDGHQIIDPLSIPNGAKIIRGGKYLLAYETIRCPDNTCPKCFNKLDNTGKCPYALPDCWKC